MYLKPYYSEEQQQFQFSRQQASHFAKKVAGDFNPIHDEDNKRFCVPGDLLFALLLRQKGIYKKMSLHFSGMVSDGIPLHIETRGHEHVITDDQGKDYCHISFEGEPSTDVTFIEHVTKNYVRFSGMNFPHIMVPLMEDKQMMINCTRPLVMYESMAVEFDHLNLSQPEVSFDHATFDIEGKRGVVTLNFHFIDQGKIVGTGTKRMIATGLRPYKQSDIDDLVNRFLAQKSAFVSNLSTAAA